MAQPLATTLLLLVALGFLQITIFALPFLYLHLNYWLNSIESFILLSFILTIIFVIHPLVNILLISFTIAPTLLSHRAALSSATASQARDLADSALQKLADFPRYASTLLKRGATDRGDMWGVFGVLFAVWVVGGKRVAGLVGAWVLLRGFVPVSASEGVVGVGAGVGERERKDVAVKQ